MKRKRGIVPPRDAEIQLRDNAKRYFHNDLYNNELHDIEQI